MTHQIQTISSEQIYKTLSMHKAIALMAEAFTDFAQHKAFHHQRDILWLPEHLGAIGTMAACKANGVMASVKVAGVFPHNANTHKDRHQGAIVLFDVEQGLLCAVSDATAITAIRTAALSAYVSDHLASKTAHHLVVFGAGVQAYQHIAALSCVRDIEQVTVINRSDANAQTLINKLNKQFPFMQCDYRSLGQHRSALKTADIICMTTAAVTPILFGDDLPEQCHINVVGACTPKQREVDTAVMTQATVYVDDVMTAEREAGDVILALADNPDIKIYPISDLLTDGPDVNSGVSVFKSVGMGIQDLYCLDYVYQTLKNTQTATSINWGGER